MDKARSRALARSPGSDDRRRGQRSAPPPDISSGRPRKLAGLRRDMGGFFSFWGAIGLLVAVAAVQGAAGHLHYLLAGEPALILDAGGLDGLAVNDRFRMRLPLDYARGVAIEEAGGDAYTLIPVLGTDDRFVVLQKGHFTPAELGRGPFELSGRVIGPGLFGDWDAGSATGATALDVPAEFRRIGARVPADVRLLVADWRFQFDEVWQMFLGLGGFAVLLWFAVRLGRAIGRLIPGKGDI